MNLMITKIKMIMLMIVMMRYLRTQQPTGDHLWECGLPLDRLWWVRPSSSSSSPSQFLITTMTMPRKQMNKTMLPTIASHCPAGTSTYTVLQYAQEIKHSETDRWLGDESSCVDDESSYMWWTLEACWPFNGIDIHTEIDLKLDKSNTREIWHQRFNTREICRPRLGEWWEEHRSPWNPRTPCL